MINGANGSELGLLISGMCGFNGLAHHLPQIAPLYSRFQEWSSPPSGLMSLFNANQAIMATAKIGCKSIDLSLIHPSLLSHFSFPNRIGLILSMKCLFTKKKKKSNF